MGRQFRSPRRGSGVSNVQPFTIPTTVDQTISIPNYGVTDLTTYAAGEYTLDAPEFGVRKTFIKAAGATASSGVVIRMSSGKTVSVGVGSTAGTQITFNTTATDTAVVLMGLNSTHWITESMYTGLTILTTGIVIAGT